MVAQPECSIFSSECDRRKRTDTDDQYLERLARFVKLLQKKIDFSPHNNHAKYRLAKFLRKRRIAPKMVSATVDRPFSLTNVELTNRCPFKCVMCPRTNHMTRQKGDMEFSTFRRIVDELALVNRANLPGCILYLHHFGESLLHRDFGEFVKYANGKGIFTSASINPLMLNDSVIDALIDSDIGLLQIALDGHDDESFARIRGVDRAYQPSRERLLRYLQIKGNSTATTHVILNIIDFPLGHASISAMYDQWTKTPGIEKVFVKPFVTWDGSAKEINLLLPKSVKIDLPKRSGQPIVCTEPFESLSITWDGDVVACCFDYNKKVVVGNVAESSLSTIWNSESLLRMRQEFIDGVVTNKLCRTCHYLKTPIEGRNILTD